MLKDFDLLGKTGYDLVTGFKGVVTCVSYDLYGCIQVILSPGIDKDGKAQEGRWFDTKRIQIINDQLVMPIPDFRPEVKQVIGSAEKPEGRL